MTALTYQLDLRHGQPMPGLAESLARRTTRVRRLLLVIAGLSVVDLFVTLFYMKTVGMYEANPIVHALAESAHPVAAIALFKLASLAIGVGLLYGFRRRTTAYIGAWLMVGVLTWLTVQWARYGFVMADLDLMTLVSFTDADPDWVRLR